MPYDPPPELAGLSLEAIAELVAARKLPPVEQWTPAHEAESHMRITADGRWYHRGGLISRPAMVRVFASILRRESDGRYALVTPFERQWIAVDDAPLVAVEVKSEGTGEDRTLAFRLNTDDMVICQRDFPLIMSGSPQAPKPYLGLWRGLQARIERNVYYDLVELALAETGDDAVQTDSFGLWSKGVFFPLSPPIGSGPTA